MTNVGIIGHTGRLGRPLVEILKKHPFANIVYTESRQEGSQGCLNDAEIIFLALPGGEGKGYLPRLDGKRIIDLSDDHRTTDGWTYGSPELNREAIKDAQCIANPGCYATSIILGLAPVARHVSGVCVAAISGISGAGLQIQQEDNFLVYKEGRDHQHLPEIERALRLENILFVPQRIDTADRGIVSTIFADYDGPEEVETTYAEFYKGMPFVRMTISIETQKVNKTNYCDIKVSRYGSKVLIVSALDNIGKGGSGQAVQNFNIMCGLDETIGLL